MKNVFENFLGSQKIRGKILGKVNEKLMFFWNFKKSEISKFSIFHWLFLRFFRKFCDPKFFQRYFSSDSKNFFLRWNLFKFVLKCAHWSPLSNEPKTIEIVRVVQKLSTKRCRGATISQGCVIWGSHLVPWLPYSRAFRSRQLRSSGHPGAAAKRGCPAFSCVVGA